MKPNDGYRASAEAAPKMLEQAFPGVRLSLIPLYMCSGNKRLLFHEIDSDGDAIIRI